jgi:tetratricopeptide (TPR) repeat protein
MIRSVLLTTFSLTFLLLLAKAFCMDGRPGVENSALIGADQLYRAGRFVEAESAYQAILKTEPNLPSAQVGLVRCMLREQKVDQAFVTAKDALAAHPNSAPLMATMGDVHFRRAEMAEAEGSYLKAQKTDPEVVDTYLGLARLYRAYSLYRHAYDQLQRAHDMAPNDPAVQRAWFGMLPRKQRMEAISAYLAGPHPDDEEETMWLRSSLAFLQATVNKPVHACKLVSKVEKTDTKLDILYVDAQHVRGYGLTVKMNGHNNHMLLDTGASGILMGRKAAEKAGLSRLTEQVYYGVGDKGMQTGYTAVADHIRVGELEFADCIVRVSDRASVTDEDGLIGADVFGSYLIDIDIPGQKLRLSPLPKRPEDATARTALNTDDESVTTPEEKPATEGEKASSSNSSREPPTREARRAPQDATPESRLPKDRYIAPDMASWTKIFRFGHQLLIPTLVNDSKPLLFLIDTGAGLNMLSTRAARSVTNVSSSDMRVRGLSGSVGKVYTGEKATLTFSRFRQNNQEILTIDLDRLCRSTGTEVSGILGFNVLRLLEVKIDYRDGLVDFYHPEMAPPRN